VELGLASKSTTILSRDAGYVPCALLAERIKRLKTVPGVEPITALTWALEMVNISRFRSIRQAISYCGLCGDERCSAEKVMRTPLAKQRKKNIQLVLVEAAKLAPRQDHDLALLYERETEREYQSSDAGGSLQDGRVSARRGLGPTGLRTCRGSQQRRGLKTEPTRKSIRITQRANYQVLPLTD